MNSDYCPPVCSAVKPFAFGLLPGLFLICMSVYAAPDQPPTQAQSVSTQAGPAITGIDTARLQQLVDQHPDTVLIDVRTQDEIKQLGTIGLYQNINIPRGWLEFRIGEAVPDKDTPVVVYCGMNVRSPPAAQTLADMGYTNVKNYSDGFFKWQAAGLDLEIPDKAPESVLYDLPQEVIDGVYSAIGATQPSTYENSGHNNNLSFIIAEDAVVVFNAGGSYLLAEAMHEQIKAITPLPVKFVVLENAQGHAILGAGYWKSQGAEIIAHEHSAEIIAQELNPEVRTEDEPGILARARRSLRDKAHKTTVVMPDRTFSDRLVLPVKGRRIELLHLGPSHSPDDIQLWMPQERLIITGDFAFNERLLPILHHTDARGWLESWPSLEALAPEVIIPGHGGVTDLQTVKHFTVDYLEYLLEQVTQLIDAGGTLLDAYAIDQSRFMQWKTFRELSRLNAERLFRKLEFE
jgi:rhodanese-related sulfurtransferase/glyoxylase-like metal-dependent hydrolase (beta-lactamase superfamily II)